MMTREEQDVVIEMVKLLVGVALAPLVVRVERLERTLGIAADVAPHADRSGAAETIH